MGGGGSLAADDVGVLARPADARRCARPRLRSHLRHGLGPRPLRGQRRPRARHGPPASRPLGRGRRCPGRGHPGRGPPEARAARRTCVRWSRCGCALRSRRGGAAGGDHRHRVEPPRRGAPCDRALARPGGLRSHAVGAPRLRPVARDRHAPRAPAAPPRAGEPERHYRPRHRRGGVRCRRVALGTAVGATRRFGRVGERPVDGLRSAPRRTGHVERCGSGRLRAQRPRGSAARSVALPHPGRGVERRVGPGIADRPARRRPDGRPGRARSSRRAPRLVAGARTPAEAAGRVLGNRHGPDDRHVGPGRRDRLARQRRAGRWAAAGRLAHARPVGTPHRSAGRAGARMPWCGYCRTPRRARWWVSAVSSRPSR